MTEDPNQHDELPGKNTYLHLIDQMADGLLTYFEELGRRRRLNMKTEHDVIPRLIEAINNPNFIQSLTQAIESKTLIYED